MFQLLADKRENYRPVRLKLPNTFVRAKALKQALDAISERLLRELPGLRGFSSGNLKKMLRTIIT